MLKILLPFLLVSSLASFSQEASDDTGSDLSAADAKEILAHHNKARAEVKVPPLAWSAKLAAYAQQWADSLATADCAFKHRQNGDYGENIYSATGSDAFKPILASQAWYAEKAKYTYSKVGEGNWRQTGHYTQMIWKNTTAVGVGIATCANGNLIVVANYDPSGNYTGEYPY